MQKSNHSDKDSQKITNASLNEMGLGIVKFLNSKENTGIDLTRLLPRETTEGKPVNSSDISKVLKSIFGESVKGDFEHYRRAGKNFFKCEHNEGKEYSQLIKGILQIIVEKNMQKTNIHYITTPNSACIIFR
mgnify:CR=1 FL=1